jgi:hypothetical protein
MYCARRKEDRNDGRKKKKDTIDVKVCPELFTCSTYPLFHARRKLVNGGFCKRMPLPKTIITERVSTRLKSRGLMFDLIRTEYRTDSRDSQVTRADNDFAPSFWKCRGSATRQSLGPLIHVLLYRHPWQLGLKQD